MFSGEGVEEQGIGAVLIMHCALAYILINERQTVL